MATLLDTPTAEKIRIRLSELTPGSKPVWGRMTVEQMLCHVNDGFLMAVGKRPIEDKSNLISRTLLKFLVLNVISIPKGVPTAPELDAEKDGTPPTEFESDRSAVLQSIDEMLATNAETKWSHHGRFGPMSRNDWGKMGYKHIDHHLRQFGV